MRPLKPRGPASKAEDLRWSPSKLETWRSEVRRLQKAGFRFALEPTDQPYLWREATLLDPDGHRVFIYHAGEMRLNPPWRLEG